MDRRRERLEEIYEEFSGLIFAYAAQRTTGPQDAADVVADTFVVAWRHIDEVPAGDEARPWLYGVARRVLANHHRGVRRRSRLHDRVATELAAGFVEATPAEGPDSEGVLVAFEALSPDDQELLTLVGWDGLDRDEVAAVVGCSRANVRVRLHRARRRFARELSKVGVQRAGEAGHGSGRWATARSDSEEA